MSRPAPRPSGVFQRCQTRPNLRGCVAFTAIYLCCQISPLLYKTWIATGGDSPSASPSTAARHIPESLMPLPELGTRQRTQGMQPGPEGDSLTILGSEPAWWFAVAGRCRKDVQSPLGRLAQTAGLISIWNLDEFAVEVLKSPCVLPSRTRTLVLPPVYPATRLDNTVCPSRSQSQSPKDGAAYGRTTASARFR